MTAGGGCRSVEFVRFVLTNISIAYDVLTGFVAARSIQSRDAVTYVQRSVPLLLPWASTRRLLLDCLSIDAVRHWMIGLRELDTRVEAA